MKLKYRSDDIPKSLGELEDILLKNRGIKDKASFLKLVNPMDISLSDVDLDEEQLKGVLARLQKAKDDNEYIVIFGDYDADGISASAILWQALFKLGFNVKPFIPHRTKHGYGVSVKAIDEIVKDKKPDLVITVDNGIVAHEPIKYLKNLGIDVIITDHHQPEQEEGKNIYPSADYVFHSTKLCGATVAWMLVRELDKEMAEESLDLCALATVADQVPLVGASRSFVKFGIEAMKKTSRVGLRVLLEKIVKDIDGLNTDTIGYIIAPRINAVGRLSEGVVALRLLCTTSRSQASRLVEEVIQTNEKRKSLTYELVKQAENLVQEQLDENIIIVASKEYHEGILGLIAGSLLQKYAKPVIAIKIDDEIGKASVRSVQGVNIVEFLRKIKDDLLTVGGHPLAGGFSFEIEKLEEIKKKLFAMAKEDFAEELLVKEVAVECVLPASLISEEAIELIESLKPFGQQNPKPVFEIRNVEIQDISSMGKNGDHLRAMLGSKDHSLKTIGWRMGKLANEYEIDDKVSVVGSLGFNVWNGRRSIQMILEDITKS